MISPTITAMAMGRPTARIISTTSEARCYDAVSTGGFTFSVLQVPLIEPGNRGA